VVIARVDVTLYNEPGARVRIVRLWSPRGTRQGGCGRRAPRAALHGTPPGPPRYLAQS